MRGLPERIGKYLVERMLGRGSSATVYLAKDEFQETDVAVKVYDAGILAQMPPMVRSQFLNEESLAGRLAHPHIAAILDAHSGEDTCYVVSEYVPGGSLYQLASSTGLAPVAEAIEIGFKCCGALDYAYRNGIVHRDLKPANVLVVGGSEIKIADFGAAFIRNANTTQILDIGSPSYVSPEQANGAELSFHSDMFSLGILLYELVTGSRPFGGDHSSEIVRNIVLTDPVVPSQVRPQLPPALDDVLLRALEKKPADRYANWVDFALALASVGRLSAFEQTIPDSERFTLLKDRPLLAGLDDVNIWELARAGQWSRVPAHTCIVHEGDAGDSLYLLADGEAKVTMEGRLLNVLGSGEWFGEMPYIIGQPGARQATVETSTDSILVEFPLTLLEALGERCQLRFAKALLRNVSDRLAFSNVRITHAGNEALR